MNVGLTLKKRSKFSCKNYRLVKNCSVASIYPELSNEFNKFRMEPHHNYKICQDPHL